MITAKHFENFIILMIVFSSVELALYSPNKNPNGHFIQSLNTIDIVTTVIFSIECLIKILTFGLIFNGKSSYLQNGWNIIDFIIVIFSVISLTPLSD